jgi:hypothetical protein
MPLAFWKAENGDLEGYSLMGVNLTKSGIAGCRTVGQSQDLKKKENKSVGAFQKKSFLLL